MEFNATGFSEGQTHLWKKVPLAATKNNAINPSCSTHYHRKLGRLEGRTTLNTALVFEQVFYVSAQDRKHNYVAICKTFCSVTTCKFDLDAGVTEFLKYWPVSLK